MSALASRTIKPCPPDPERFWADAEVLLEPDDPRPGSWAGGPSAQLVDGTWWLAYRLRRPVGEGRGFVNVVARSDDGVRFTPVVAIGKDTFGAESLERPALVHTPEGRWRLYLSCATPGTKHWRVDLLEAGSVEALATATPRTVLAGSETLAVKDPVIRYDGARWHLWASVHPLDDPTATDRMRTDHATSPDGVEWTWRGAAPTRPPGRWGGRGGGVAAVGRRGARSRGPLRGGGAGAACGSPQSCSTVRRPGPCTTGGRRRRRTGRSGPVWPARTATDVSSPRSPVLSCRARTRHRGCATPTSWPCRGVVPAGSTRRRGPTAGTSCARSCWRAERANLYQAGRLDRH